MIRLGKIGARLLYKIPSAMEYVQDGLVAMWDGIENAGWGVHDPNATEWVDLTGSGNTLVRYNTSFTPSWGDNCMAFDGAMRTMKCDVTGVGANFAVEVISLGFDFSNGYPTSFSNRLLTNDPKMIYLQRGCWNTFGAVRGSAVPENIIAAQAISVYGASLSMYNNGILDKTGAWASQYAETVFPNHVMIGNTYQYDYSSAHFNGYIYCVRLYSRALTADEIAHNYKIDKERFNLP